MEEKLPHAQLIIEAMDLGGGQKEQRETKAMVSIKLNGCKVCLKAAITHMLLNNPEFKEIINSCIREVNQIRAKNMN